MLKQKIQYSILSGFLYSIIPTPAPVSAELLTYQQLNFKKLNAEQFTVYEKSAPANWTETIIPDNHKKHTDYTGKAGWIYYI
jgi:hypothetical protein